MSAAQTVALLLPIAYLLGSIPFGLIVARSRGVDPRAAGSGNIGATNVGRLLGRKYFAIVFVLDLAKGAIPMLAAGWVLRDEPKDRAIYLLWLLVGGGAILGHMFSLFLGFKGGKGVATSLGVVIGLFPYFTLPALIGVGIFLGVYKVWRYFSLGSIVGAVAFPLVYAALGVGLHWDVLGRQLPLLAFAVSLAGLIVFKHRTNIARLRAGTESHGLQRGERGLGPGGHGRHDGHDGQPAVNLE